MEQVSGAILNNVLHSGLKGRFSPALISQLSSSAFSLSELDLSDEDRNVIMAVYMRGLNTIFVSYAGLTAVMFLLSLCLHDYGLTGRRDTKRQVLSHSEDRNRDLEPGAGSNQ